MTFLNNFTAMPWGKLPCLEYDGKKIVQSIAMARFVARENKLAGKNNLEAAQADMLVDCMNDLLISEYCGPKKSTFISKSDEVNPGRSKNQV